MQIAIPFQANGKYNDCVDEFLISYSDRNNFNNLINFVSSYSDKTISIDIKKDIDFKEIETLNKIGKIKIILPSRKWQLYSEFNNKNIDFYFKEGLIASNYHQLHFILSLGVSDIYIADDLCYELDKVRKYCADNGTKMRVVLNTVPHTMISPKDKEIVFYRPEDNFWREYYDIAEFNIKDDNWNLLKVLYETYFIDKKWLGNLQEIIIGLPFAVYNKALVPEFNDYKINCKLKCKNRHSICRKCSQLLSISNLLAEKNIRFNK